jgi:hypothetical protein
MPRTSVRQEPSTAAPMTPRGAWSDNVPACGVPSAVWLDLTLLNRTALTQMLERYALPLEVTTYFQLKFQSPKVIAVDRALFLVTCGVAPSSRQLFAPHELKLCVTPTLVAGLYDRVLRTLSPIGSILSQPVDLSSGGVARFVWEVLGGIVESYEAVAATISNHGLARKGTEDLGVWQQRVAALVEVIEQQQVFLYNVARAGRKVGVEAQQEKRAALDTRLERLMGIIGDVRQTERDMPPRFDT